MVFGRFVSPNEDSVVRIAGNPGIRTCYSSSVRDKSPTHSSRHFCKSFWTPSRLAGGSPPTRKLPQNGRNVRVGDDPLRTPKPSSELLDERASLTEAVPALVRLTTSRPSALCADFDHLDVPRMSKLTPGDQLPKNVARYCCPSVFDVRFLSVSEG
jgi:hypothetical protein